MHPRALFPFFGLSPISPALRGTTRAIPDVLGVQHSFNSLGLSKIHATWAAPKGDPAGRPNLATRLEITSPVSHTLFCARKGDRHQSGYAHFTNAVGQEDKHMFWTLFEAKFQPDDAPVLLYFGGGPGTSGMTVPFSGQGHCKVVPGPDGNGTAVPSEYPWTDFAHILAVDYPVGTGFSYGDQGSLRNSSERAAWDLDDLLQAFWRANPGLAKNQFAVGSGSYGGTYIPNLVNVIRQRNIDSLHIGNTSRLHKMPDTVMMSNPYGDPVAISRYAHVIQCDDMGYFNASVCEDIVRSTPACLDAYQLAEEQPTIHNKVQAMEDCASLTPWHHDVSGKSPYDVRHKCNIEDINDCFPSFAWMENTMNDPRIREAFGIPENVTYKFIAMDEIGIPFAMNGDLSQRAYKLLTPAVNEGMRLLVYNGVDDAVCPSRATESWLRLLQSKHQSAFRGALENEWPGVGSFYSVGEGGAGQLAFVKIQRAGHFVIGQQPKATKHLAEKWLRNENFA